MRTIRHWTPRYMVNRTRTRLFMRTHPDVPWLTARAINVLDGMLLPTDRGLEYGSGLSTLWLARRVSQFVSVEHDAEWHDKVSGQLKKHSLSNVDHRFAPQDEPETQGDRSEYARVALEVPDSSLNFVLVDGVHRDHCARLALPKLAPGGLLIIDNVNWFLPCDSHGPASRRHEDGPAGVVWTEVYQTIRHWRTIWTTNHVWDTAIFIKPH